VKCNSCQTEIQHRGTCPNCGLEQPKTRCSNCFRKFYKSYLVQGQCQECYEKELLLKPKNPFIAAILGIFPGLGHLYIGQGERFALYFVLVLFLWFIPVIGWLIALFVWVISILEAFMTASRIKSRVKETPFEVQKNSSNFLLFSHIGSMLDYNKKYITILINIIRYTIGLFFLLVGIVYLFDGNTMSAFYALGIGIILTLVTSNFIKKKLNIQPRVPVILIILVFLFIGFVAVSPGDQAEHTVYEKPPKSTYHNPYKGMVPVASDSKQMSNSTALSVEPVVEHVKESKTKPVENITQEVKETRPEPVKSETKPTTYYQDTQWISITTQYSEIIGNDMKNIATAAENSDYISMSNYGSALYYDSEAAIEESQKYEVSSAIQPAKDEFERALYYSRDAGSDIVSAVYELNQGRNDEAKAYMTSASSNMKACGTHTKKAAHIVDDYKRK